MSYVYSKCGYSTVYRQKYYGIKGLLQKLCNISKMAVDIYSLCKQSNNRIYKYTKKIRNFQLE